MFHETVLDEVKADKLWISWNRSKGYLLLLSKTIELVSSRFSRARRRGPWDTEYTSSIMWRSSERFFRSLIGQGLAHWEVGSVALQIITWQWTKTSGWSAINLKASRKNRWALGEGEGRSFTVSSTGHLEKRNTVKLSIASNCCRCFSCCLS